ncbi:MAG: hypothetical protein JOZ24_03770 [Candidatus Eremiobacteraeota bacterium]|nr:hypothetical protein [Candidatus Eremiobacteraeota bacterium]
MTRLLAAAGGFTGTVVAGTLLGLLVARATHADWWLAAGLFIGLFLGIGAIVLALRPLLRSE